MLTDRVLALLALAALIVFLAVPMVFLKRVDVTVVMVVVIVMACYDFYRQLRAR